ncbi:MAG: hypothetical protein ACREH8_19195 [Opitutaceae bacterium]
MDALPLRILGWLLLAGVACAQPAATAKKAGAAITRTQITQGIASARMERVAPNRGVLTVATKSEASSDLRLLDSTLKEVATTRTPDGAIKAEIDPQRGYILTPPARGRVPLSKDGTHLPARYVTFGPTGATNLGGLFLRPAVVPLTWNEQLRTYATELFVGYEFEDGREVNLPVPRTVTLFAEGANARIQADRVTVTKSGGAGYQRVVLSTGQIDGETHFTARVSAADELKSSVTVLREPGGLKLSIGSPELPAFGVGSDVLTVSVIGRDGSPFPTTKPLEVQLTSRGLRQPAMAVIETGQSGARVDVRSVGYGPGEIVAQSGAFRTALPLMLVFPIAPIVGSLLGGGLGGGARFLRNKRRGGSLLARRTIEGMLVGLILVGAAWAGLVAVDVSTGVLGTPFGAFVLGALSGYLGCVVLDRVAKKTFGGLDSKSSAE